MHIRKATVDDAPACFAIRRDAIRAQCGGHYPDADLDIWTSGVMSATFAQRVADYFYVAVADGHLVGTAMIDLVTGKIDAVFVLSGYMGRGIGRALMAQMESLAQDAGLDSIQLESTLNAAPFYRALGFQGDTLSTYQSSLGVSLTCVPMVKHMAERTG
ncbi:GNAT family N-acetyltransferase [Dyella sp.]|uniref:GNAT family N-acetyltransferase n=1 Tax=Dyella sp. TaxID=1869338 RepID=UPI00285135FC|nr:GNAT family N-acetyltransferase [Dyella sp.]MDR3447435.1 GNAT family N-acetyltransferase [Dyella sp.]